MEIEQQKKQITDQLVDKKVCKNFIAGGCNFEGKCKFKHVIPGSEKPQPKFKILSGKYKNIQPKPKLESKKLLLKKSIRKQKEKDSKEKLSKKEKRKQRFQKLNEKQKTVAVKEQKSLKNKKVVQSNKQAKNSDKKQKQQDNMEIEGTNSQKKVVLCMDLLNYCQKFFKLEGSNKWNLQAATDEVKKFLASIPAKYELICFMDGIRKSEEVQRKWKKRKEQNVKTGNRKMPVAFGDILGEIFANQGVQVYYCLEDADDTIANWAFHKKGIVLGEDKDYFRYHAEDEKKNFYSENAKARPYKLFAGFDQKANKFWEHQNLKVESFDTNFIKVTNEKTQKYFKIEKRAISSSLLQVTKKNILQVQIKQLTAKKNKILFGDGSCATKMFGNPYKKFSQLRAALYYKLGIRFTVQEEFVDWNKEEGKVKWTVQEVEPEQNDELLKNPETFIEKNMELFPQVCENSIKQKIMRHNVNVGIIGTMYAALAAKQQITSYQYIKELEI